MKVMVKSSKRLQTVLKLAKLRQQQAADQLAQCQHAQQSQQQQMEQLQSYQDQYNCQFQSQTGQAINPMQLNNYQLFYNSLDEAVRVAQHRQSQVDYELEQARNQWQQSYSKQKTMESLVEAKQHHEQQEQANKEQRVLDDRAATVTPSTP